MPSSSGSRNERNGRRSSRVSEAKQVLLLSKCHDSSFKCMNAEYFSSDISVSILCCHCTEAAKSRSRTTPSDARSRGGDTHASEEYDKFNADAELPKRPPMLEPSAKGDKPASQLNIYNSMGAISAISDVSDSATEDMTDTSAADHHAHHHGRSSGVRGGSLASRGSSSRAGGGSGGRAGASGNAGSGGGGEQFSPNLPPNLHTSLAKCDWPAFHRALQHLSQSPSLIIPSVSMTDPENPNDSTTPLHTACWKAPPTLALMLIRLLPSSRELSGIFTARDGDDNTALHLCCANLERMVDGDSSGASGGINTSVLEALVKAAPRALKMQNAEGDTPLQMLVSSSACLPKTWDLSPESRNYDSAGISSEHVLNLLLNAGGGEEAIMKDMTGATPLHVAIAAGAHGRVIDTLIAAAPQALKMPDNRGMLPMHYVAAFCRTPMASVKRMLEIYGDALFAHTTNGDTPLHLLVSNSSNIIQAKSNRAGDDSKDEGPMLDRNMVRIVEALMGPADGGRSPLIMTNREKLTPLHCCALFDAPPRLSQLLMTHPSAKEASAMANSFGATPLHLASAQPSVAQSIATVLAVGTPEAAAVKDRLKRTPLHVASQNVHATPHLIKALAQLHPQATAEKTQRGHLPLHLAAQSQAKETVIKALIKAYPKATQAKNKSSNTPLHDAAKYRASVGAVKLLLETYPDAVYIQNQYGNLPIHCACAYQAPKDVVSLLLGAYPKGASTQNRNRDTPIHYTAAYATDPATVDPLIDAAPGALLLVNSSGQTPVDRAKANNAPKEIVALLEDRAADAEASGAGRTMQEDSWGEGEFDNARPFQ